MVDPKIRLLYYLLLKRSDNITKDVEATVVWVTHRLRGSCKEAMKNDNNWLIWSILKELMEDN